MFFVFSVLLCLVSIYINVYSSLCLRLKKSLNQKRDTGTSVSIGEREKSKQCCWMMMVE